MKKHLKISTYTSLLITVLLVVFSSKSTFGKILLCGWTVSTEASNSTINEQGETEHIAPENLTTWIFEDGTFIPMAKLQGEKSYSIITDHLGTPVESYDGAVFWSGQNMHTAQQWAADNGKTTLEQTKGGKYLNDLDLFNPKSGLTGSEAAQVWDVASKRFAEGASGDVNVFSTGAKRFGPYGERTWWRIEKKALLSNSNVNTIFRRKQNGALEKTGHVHLKCS